MRVLVFGDSQALGPPGRAIRDSLRAAGHEVALVGEVGVGPVTWAGSRAPEYLATLEQTAPDVVLFVFGTNDQASGRLEAALRWLRGSHPRAWYSGPPQYLSQERRAIGFHVRQLAAEAFGRRYIDVWDATRSGALYASDGVHMTPEGGATWARVVTQQLDAPGFPWLGLLGLASAAALGVLLARRA